VLYNRFWNDQGSAGLSTKGLQIYAHCPNGLCPSTVDHFIDVTVANNQFLDNCMEGAAIGGTDGGTAPYPWDGSGTLYVYNNLFAGNGSCDTIKDQTFSGLQIGDGYGGMNAKIWNNTFYLNAGGSLGDMAGDVYAYAKSPVVQSYDFSNNIFYAQPTGQHYDDFIYQDTSPSGSASTFTGSNNLFFSNSNSNANVPSWATSTVSTANPLFLSPAVNTGSGTGFHLQDTSPAKNGGATLATTPDADGVARPQNTTYGLGAYELPSGSPPPGVTFYFRGH
jgi:hypothetical protein